jgi:hypothetical protein
MKVASLISRMLIWACIAPIILGISDGHWAMLQTAAWGRMIVQYSRSSSLRTALEQTFDGRHPCAMCKMIQKAKQSSKQQELQHSSVKDDLVFLQIGDCFNLDLVRSWITGATNSNHPSRGDPPPVPPPRSHPLYS